jgi:peptide/nickel transport system ATP-binding protein
MSAPLLEVRDLVRAYALPRERMLGPKRQLHAVDGVSFAILAGRSFGIVGESGSGKSTLARAVLALETPTSGAISLLGRDLATQSPSQLRELRACMQMIFQDPFGSLDPRHTIRRIVAEPLSILGAITPLERRARVDEALRAVGLDAGDALKYPHEFSGGQRQRIAIARALITRPKLVVADEPVSALDVSVQAQVLNLMNDLAGDSDVTYLLISHDLAVVANLCDTIAVMFAGRFVETGPSEVLLRSPAHPYTRTLIDAAPSLTRIATQSPLTSASVADAPAQRGCAYAGRCQFARKECRDTSPVLAPRDAERSVSCHFPLSNQ